MENLHDICILIVTFAAPRLTDPDDSAAVSPISVATRTHVIVMVRYVDSDGVRYDSEGTTDVDFTYDERPVVTLDGDHSGCVSFDAEHGWVLARLPCLRPELDLRDPRLRLLVLQGRQLRALPQGCPAAAASAAYARR